jgi:hypothetical protein
VGHPVVDCVSVSVGFDPVSSSVGGMTPGRVKRLERDGIRD